MAGRIPLMTIGNNIIFSNFTVTKDGSSGGLMANGSGDIELGNNVSFINNTITGMTPLGALMAADDGSITFGNNTQVIDNSSTANWEYAQNIGMIYADKGIYINGTSGTTLFKNNNIIGGYYGVGGVLATSGNIELIGNAIITGNSAKGEGGAFFVNGSTNAAAPVYALLRPNGGEITFRDNKSAGNPNSIYMGPNSELRLDFSNGGEINFYDPFILDEDSSGKSKLVQLGNGRSRLWGENIVSKDINIAGGILSLQSEITLPSSINQIDTIYTAGSLSGEKVFIGTDTTVATLDIHDGAKLISSDYVQLKDGNTLNLYGSGSINLDTSIIDGYRHLASSSELRVGSSNTINLAARVDPMTYNTRSNYTALHIASMGVNNNLIVNADLANNIADKFVVTNATGNNIIGVQYDPGFLRTTKPVGRALVVESANNSDIGTFSGSKYDAGVIAYTPVIESGNPMLGERSVDWYLVGYDKTPSTTLDASFALAMASTGITTEFAMSKGLTSRMGELRNQSDHYGVWASVSAGENTIRTVGNQRYNIIQGGYDWSNRTKSARAYTGISIEHITANTNIIRGTGKSSANALSLYHTWLSDSGRYWDIVLKTGRIGNNLNTVNTQGVSLTGDYKNWANSISLEYGQRTKLQNSYYIQPEMQLVLTNVRGTNYKVNNIDVNQKNSNFAMGRIGITVGRELKNSRIFATLNALHNFTGSVGIDASDGINTVTLQDNIKGTWGEFTFGYNGQLSKNTHMYLEATKGFGGGQVQRKWDVNLGFRWLW